MRLQLRAARAAVVRRFGIPPDSWPPTGGCSIILPAVLIGGMSRHMAVTEQDLRNLENAHKAFRRSTLLDKILMRPSMIDGIGRMIDDSALLRR
jgi:hypothetical protein